MKAAFFAISMLLAAFSAVADETNLFASLTLGDHAVGFDEWRDGGLLVSAWYPARAGGSRMTFGDYVGNRRAGFTEFLAGAGLPAAAISEYLDARMLAVRGATILGGRFPLVAMGQGNGHSAADQAVLSEYLASHGYVVVTTPSPMIETPMKSADEIGKFAEIQALELGRAIDAVQKRYRIDRGRIGVIGHSFGARAALLLAMRDPRIRAIVSLDGGIGTSSGVESMKAAPSFDIRDVPPILHLFELQDAFMTPDLQFLRAISPAGLHTENLDALRHVHFTTLGFASAAIPEIGKRTRAPADIGAKMAQVATSARRFLDVCLNVSSR
ncbi:MAG: hypothetical protein JJE51_01710 [Thermoanaerobaculia bacterium]|nr:hypothetical protein [Thermoanaerobaculia bacterium]